MGSAKIIGTGRYVPDKCVTNEEFDEQYGQDVGTFLREQVGIRERHFAAEDEIASDLAVNAGRKALDQAGWSSEDIDLLIVATDTPDYISPATANVVQHKLGASNAGVFDLNNACAAFVSGLITVSKYLGTEPERYRHALVIGTYAMSKYVNWDDYKTATIFADGAGAVALRASEEPGILSSSLAADGQYHDYMGIYVGGTFQIPDESNLDEKYLVIAKRFPPELNATHWPMLIREVVANADRDVSEIAYVGAQLGTHGLALAIEQSGELTRQSFIDALNTVNAWSTGLTPPLSYGPDDHAGIEQLFIVKVQDGTFINAGTF